MNMFLSSFCGYKYSLFFDPVSGGLTLCWLQATCPQLLAVLCLLGSISSMPILLPCREASLTAVCWANAFITQQTFPTTVLIFMMKTHTDFEYTPEKCQKKTASPRDRQRASGNVLAALLQRLLFWVRRMRNGYHDFKCTQYCTR